MKSDTPGSDAKRSIAPFLVFAIGLVSGLVWLCTPWFHVQSAFSEEERVAIHLTRGEGFASPFQDGTAADATSWCPPVYPVLVAGIYGALGVRSAGAILAVLIFNLVCCAAAGAAIYCLGRRMIGAGGGWVAAGLFWVNPIFLNAAVLCWDNSLALAMFLWLLVASRHVRGRAGIIGLGVGSGILLLTNVAYAAAVPVVLVMGAFSSKGNTNSKVGWALPTTAGKGGQCPPYMRIGWGIVAVVVTLLPWTARNYVQFNRLFFVRGNLAAELWLGNQPGTTGWTTMAMLAAHPSDNTVERALVLKLKEMKYFDLCRQRFWEEIEVAPMDFVRRCGYRAAYLVLGEPSRSNVAMDVTLAGIGLAGIWIAGRRRAQIAGLVIACLLAGLPYLAAQVHDRYALPVRAMLTLMAAVGICAVT